jgi:hypothetical protein
MDATRQLRQQLEQGVMMTLSIITLLNEQSFCSLCLTCWVVAHMLST